MSITRARGIRFGLLAGALVAAGVAAAPTAATAAPRSGSAVAAATTPPAHRFGAPDRQQNDRFGASVGLSGTTAVIGSPESAVGAGRVYIYSRSTGPWILQAEIPDPAGVVDDFFGTAVAASGDTIVVGAPQALDNTGAAYVFVRSGTHWVQQGTLLPPDPGFQFGYAVALAGDTALVSKPYGDDTTTTTSGVYVFHRAHGVWTLVQKIDGPAFVLADLFGQSVALSGSTAVIGDGAADPQGAGAAFVYVNGTGGWVLQAKLTGENTTDGVEFGTSVAIAGDLVVAGAPDEGTGVAYVFTRSAGQWTRTLRLVGSDSLSGDEFGSAVGVSARMIVVGAPRFPRTENRDRGAAYVFVPSGGTWVQSTRLMPPTLPVASRFGRSMAVTGARALVAAPGAPNSRIGIVYLFNPLASALAP